MQNIIQNKANSMKDIMVWKNKSVKGDTYEGSSTVSRRNAETYFGRDRISRKPMIENDGMPIL